MQAETKRTFTVEILPLDGNAGGRKLRAQWSPELAQDLQEYHSIDVEAQLSAIIAYEIDKEIINSLFNLSINKNNYGS